MLCWVDKYMFIRYLKLWDLFLVKSNFFGKIIIQKYPIASINSYIYWQLTLFHILSQTKRTILIYSSFSFSHVEISFGIFFFFILISFPASHVRKDHKLFSMKPSPTNLCKHIVSSFDLIWPCHVIMDMENCKHE